MHTKLRRPNAEVVYSHYFAHNLFAQKAHPSFHRDYPLRSPGMLDTNTENYSFLPWFQVSCQLYTLGLCCI